MKKAKMKQKKIIISISIILVALVAVIVGALYLNPKEEIKLDPPKIEEVQEEVTIVDINSTSRPFAIMVNNHSSVRPYHMGLQDAYILYEIVVESGITRFLALYKDVDTERIHGIRSARHYYLDYAMENDAVFIHWGASPQAEADLKKLDIDSIGVSENAYAARDLKLPVATEHNTYTSIELLTKGVENRNIREETNVDLLLKYSAKELDMTSYDDMEIANSVSIKYSNSYISNFEYNEETNSYYKSTKNTPHTDYVTKEQYHFTNIITYQVENYTIPGEEVSKRQDLENHNTSGMGHFISGGYAIPIKWSKGDRDEQTIYTYMDGTELVVNDGNTYIAIQPKGNELTIK